MEDERELFVGRLPDDIKEDEVRLIFNTYGKVADVRLMPRQEGPKDMRTAFVTYETIQGGKAAVQVLHNVYRFRTDAQDPIRVSVAKPRGGKGKDSGKGWGDYDRSSRGGHDSYSDHGSYSDRGGDRGKGRDYDRGRPMARGNFDRGGSDRNDRGSARPGYDRTGYDRGSDRGGYERPGSDRGGYERPGYERPPYDRGSDRGAYERPGGGYDRGPASDRGSDRGYDRGSYERGRVAAFERGSYVRPVRGGCDAAPWSRSDDRDYRPSAPPPRKGPGTTKLYVGNLPGDISQECVESVFKTYGRLEDVHIMTGRSKSGQACAFVVYQSVADADSAVLAMQKGYEIRPGEGPLVVKAAEEGKGKGKGKSDRYAPY
eukprot:TRINITY_DN2342_c0_g1_i1.p1 TRINITY_DN2342_c0_g1~~TRINITY_DN2342_c0_g1_i1.p1  ORF type:complete len:397 (-),score=71.93 TRINITY_DN2342_c0_g1_i1:45-1163(-)